MASTRDARRERLKRLQQQVSSMEQDSAPDPEVTTRTKRNYKESSSATNSGTTIASKEGRERKRSRPLAALDGGHIRSTTGSLSETGDALSMVVERTSLDLAREEANIQRKKSAAILQSELGRQSEKAGHLDRMLRDSVSKQAIADALVAER